MVSGVARGNIFGATWQTYEFHETESLKEIT